MPNFILRYFLVLFCLSSFTSALSQVGGTSKGKEFWLTFIPNIHRGVGALPGSQDDQERRSDSLYIFVAAEVPTTGKITYRDIYNRQYVRNFTISNPSQIYSFSVMWDGFELVGVNSGSELLPDGGQTEKRAVQSFKVETDNDVMVYALNQAWTTSDAFLVLPRPALERDYYVMSYPSDNIVDDRTGRLSIGSTPSQFAVVAVENNTRITFTPTAPMLFAGRNPNPVVLNAGDVYLVQALPSTTINHDLTGTGISSDKPIAVFAGHQRARIPQDGGFDLTSRDCIVEQMVPTTNYGKSAFLTPYPLPQDASPVGWDVYRVLAAIDSTPIFVDSVRVTTLNAGQYFTGRLTKAAEVYSDKPFMVAQYKKTSSTGNTGLANSDPFMMMIPPYEQFLPSYRFISAQAVQLNSNSERVKVYNFQYVNVVAPVTVIDKVVLDGANVSQSQFSRIGGSRFFYATIPVTDGVHNISAPEPIGIYVYGYGPANSYGYIGGMSFTLFDYRPPHVISKQACYKLAGTVFDSSASDSHIQSIIAENPENVNVTIDAFTGLPDSVAFNAELIDPFNDGSFTLTAKDSAGYTTTKKFDIPGFTVLVKGDTIPVAIQKDGPIKKEFCFPITITNEGNFPQTIQAIRIEDAGPVQIRLNTQLPITIPPGLSSDIIVCAIGDSIGKNSAKIFLENDCVKRHVVNLLVTTNADLTPPTIITKKNDCGLPVTFTISDETLIDSGLDSVMIVESESINITSTITRNGDKAIVNISIIDQYQDAKYTVLITDKAGNRRVLSDSVPGLTITVSDLKGQKISALAFDSTALGTTSCDSIVIENTGRYPISFSQIFMSINLAFSVPVSQIPFTIPAGEKKTLAVCYHPLIAANDIDTMERDTLGLYFACSEKLINLTGIGVQLKGKNNTSCDVMLRSEIVSVPGLIAGPYPHPIQDRGTIEIGIKEQGHVSIHIRNAFNPIDAIVLHDQFMMSGNYTISFPTTEYSSGLWIMEVMVHGNMTTIPILINK
ncbi:hypothetical protein EBV26_04025 [bacterium]|nr:hypothetical protein [bacterium]